MLELCFDESTRGGLCLARHCGDQGGMAVIATGNILIRREEAETFYSSVIERA